MKAGTNSACWRGRFSKKSGRIEREFLKLGSNQPVAVQSLKDKVEQKLQQMLQDNPFRVDYYERYQRIIEEYNTGKEYGAIKDIFDKLVDFYGDLSEEGKRAVREDLNEEELAVLDMLGRDKKISDPEKAELKDIAKQLLERLKEKEFRIIHWADKEQTAFDAKGIHQRKGLQKMRKRRANKEALGSLLNICLLHGSCRLCPG